MAERVLDFDIEMHCSGCSTQLNNKLKILAKKPEQWHIKDYEVSLEKQHVRVTGDEEMSFPGVLSELKKTDKKVIAGQDNGVAQTV